MKFTTIALALFASVSAIQIQGDPTTDDTMSPAVMPPMNQDLAEATKDKKHMIGTHYLLHAKKDIDALLLEAKNSEHDANTPIRLKRSRKRLKSLKVTSKYSTPPTPSTPRKYQAPLAWSRWSPVQTTMNDYK